MKNGFGLKASVTHFNPTLPWWLPPLMAPPSGLDLVWIVCFSYFLCLTCFSVTFWSTIGCTLIHNSRWHSNIAPCCLAMKIIIFLLLSFLWMLPQADSAEEGMKNSLFPLLPRPSFSRHWRRPNSLMQAVLAPFTGEILDPWHYKLHGDRWKTKTTDRQFFVLFQQKNLAFIMI